MQAYCSGECENGEERYREELCAGRVVSHVSIYVQLDYLTRGRGMGRRAYENKGPW